MQGAGVAAVLHLNAAIDDDVESRLDPSFSGLEVNDAELHPYALRANRDRVLNDPRNLRSGPEDVHDVNLFGNAAKVRIAPLAKNLRCLRVDGDDAVALVLQIARHHVARLGLLRGQSHHGDRLRDFEQALDSPRVLVPIPLLGGEARVKGDIRGDGHGVIVACEVLRCYRAPNHSTYPTNWS